MLLRRRERGLRILTRTFYACSFFTLLAGLVNLQASNLLGTPINYQWLYYSDFLTTFDANQAVADTVSATLLAAIAACEIGLFLTAWVVGRGLGRLIIGRRSAAVATGVVGVASWIYFSMAGPYLLGRADYAKFANPICAFATSVFASSSYPQTRPRMTPGLGGGVAAAGVALPPVPDPVVDVESPEVAVDGVAGVSLPSESRESSPSGARLGVPSVGPPPTSTTPVPTRTPPTSTAAPIRTGMIRLFKGSL